MKKGIILAGGTGSRLEPLTHVVNKHLLGVGGDFVIDYPLRTLQNMGVEDVVVILGGPHFSQVVGYLQDGSRYGMNFTYVYQGKPLGIAQAINLCKKQIGNENFAVILGDNVYENPIEWSFSYNCAQVVLHEHPELERFGVASIRGGQIVKIEEKPRKVDSSLENYAITGCYSFTPEYFDFFKEISPSPRGEYEITDIINIYNRLGKLKWTKVGGLWSDAGTHDSIGFINNYFYNKGKK